VASESEKREKCFLESDLKSDETEAKEGVSPVKSKKRRDE
jgi:hypothetical protein